MRDIFAKYIWILWAVVIPLGLPLGFLVQRFWLCVSPLVRNWLILLFAASVAFSMLTVLTPWSVRGAWAQSLNLALGYISAACLLCVALKRAAA